MGKASLKQVLRNFLQTFEDMEGTRDGPEHEDRYLSEFCTLKELTERLKRDPDPGFSCSEGLKEVNRRKNRYKDILPYDYTRVVIEEYPGVPGSDYINANYVKGSTGSTCAYIASQGQFFLLLLLLISLSFLACFASCCTRRHLPVSCCDVSPFFE